MPQPRTKTAIMERLRADRRRLEQNLAGLKREQLVEPGVVGQWSIKDVLAHLADWEAHMSIWLDAARSGDLVEGLDPGLTWEQLDLFNERVYRAHRDESLDHVLEYFRGEHERFMAMVEAMPEDEMLERGRYAFLDKQAIYDWLGAYAAHDAWAKTAIRKWLKGRAQGTHETEEPAG